MDQKAMRVANQGSIGGLSLAAFSLTLSVMMAVLCQAIEKVPQRMPRQASEDEGPGSRMPGVWSVWGSWSGCSQPCGLGVLERTRMCQSPYQRVPWAGRPELAPQPIYPQQPPYQEERANNPYPVRPSYPLHTERNVRPALSFRGSSSMLPLHSQGRPPHAPYSPQNRYTRHEAFPAEELPSVQSRDVVAPHSNRRRDSAPFRDAAHLPRPRENQDPPSRAVSQRLPHGVNNGPFRHADSAQPPTRDSIPLFKPLRRGGHEAGLSPNRHRHRSQADSGRHSWAASLVPESQAAQRSLVREAIKPGKYGYGKVPFALPLHKDAAEGATARFKRHHGDRAGEPPPPPPPPPLPFSKKQKRKAIHSSSREEDARAEKEAPTASTDPRTPREPKQSLLADAAAQPPVQVTEEKSSGEAERRGKPATASPESHGDANQPGHSTAPAGDQQQHPPPESSAVPRAMPEEDLQPESSTGSSIPTEDEGEEESNPTATVMPSRSQLPSLAGNPSPQAQGDMPLTHQVLRNHSSAPKRKGPETEKGHQATPELPRRSEISSVAQTERAGHPPHGHARSRNQRQNEHQAAGLGRRLSHSLFVDQPIAPRPAEPDIRLVHRGNPVQFHARGQRLPAGGRPGGDVPQWNLYYPGTETFHCEGESKQFKACRQQPCPPDRPDARAVQCSAYNSQEFMGRLYQWEPFTDVRGSQRCELNCRPIGYRFYVRHTEKVHDGTPCEASSLDICVAGQCLTPGCDGILGSNRTLDSCGVCGGDHTTCKLVVGNFSDTDVAIGYHRILEIPAGATRIQVKEITRSPNYLALRSHSGKSIINGNWAVNPPGSYEAAGTVFVYSRPGSDRREGESLMAEGPTTEPIDVYMIFQQDNPGVSYQFFLASAQPESPNPDLRRPRQDFGALTMVPPSNQMEPPAGHLRPRPADTRNLIPPRFPVLSNQSGRSHAMAPVPPISASQSGRRPGILQRNVRVPPLPPPPQYSAENPHDFYWRRIGNTDCSATCGKGFWQSVYRCVSRASQEEVGEEKCHLFPKPIVSEEACNTEPCPAYWDTGEWSACSKSCGLGTQHRQVLCRQIYANRTTMVHPQHCGQLEKPNGTQACQVQMCSHWEVRTNWSSCSVLCGTGHRTRHVRCISNHGDLLRDSDCPGNHRPKTSEACDMGPCVRTWFYSDWSNTCSAECGTGIQRRSVVCLSSNANGQEEENCAGTKPADMRACNGGPCQRVTQWYRGPWSPCSSDCGTGTQRRDIICVSKLGTEFNVTEASECIHLEKPPTLQSCVSSFCEAHWFSTAWSMCSKSCVGGVQVREVQCLTQNKTLSSLCPPDLKPIKKRPCNIQPCLPDLDENCRDKYHNCPVIVQARLCVYSYYKAVCCASCTHALERRHAGPSR
ncbi:ADAMTS-like protein 4 [Rhineura floridana]|uniref:ADAMTS-like protein 4 n=1 Tax=Rhineura floridana TaxID=261503 RepID=UPI002AC84001|nr:ADAMTS-like protein 4 [Rhineura floridana]XP_061461639.1 ADAMTS-like protein 4 [Rhineura floridana]XP_061461640.1 ADAMTS-like protein 4 [Rhineura floridana]XP_061461641.1 ADAMTS-like protein 4 [Rhineura floridana]XP_061461642.1 ADAMTS-like protein 4 [Rhineura floridana]XP_061461643.1 ADAMTS-like protein 4 [Rhineura floridana]XP_061461644.1 ADAMTS-like protein 4 [Rhineura floridana]XP_061461645.1 ADAMTS-like protein 4 [Rhineura floridana]XP_061461646.1 ADAMTS-like protein 4 [Rhineura flor